MSVVVPDEILTAICMTEAEMRQEIAVMLFQREKLTLLKPVDLLVCAALRFNTCLPVVKFQCITA
ncbi:UPF0175 family protein [Leptolyngbya sp. AS-A5]|nr:UPF0175 family protein [Leptolyngbya sp. FACHB-17]